MVEGLICVCIVVGGAVLDDCDQVPVGFPFSSQPGLLVVVLETDELVVEGRTCVCIVVCGAVLEDWDQVLEGETLGVVEWAEDVVGTVDEEVPLLDALALEELELITPESGGVKLYP